MFDEVFALFEPGHQHLVDERERQRLEITRPGDGAPPFGIDLDAGIVYLEPGPVRSPDPPPLPET
ncbi:DUF6191 domain-containing protein [Georgenia yuyongxinii]